MALPTTYFRWSFSAPRFFGHLWGPKWRKRSDAAQGESAGPSLRNGDRLTPRGLFAGANRNPRALPGNTSPLTLKSAQNRRRAPKRGTAKEETPINITGPRGSEPRKRGRGQKRENRGDGRKTAAGAGGLRSKQTALRSRGREQREPRPSGEDRARKEGPARPYLLRRIVLSLAQSRYIALPGRPRWRIAKGPRMRSRNLAQIIRGATLPTAAPDPRDEA